MKKSSPPQQIRNSSSPSDTSDDDDHEWNSKNKKKVTKKTKKKTRDVIHDDSSSTDTDDDSNAKIRSEANSAEEGELSSSSASSASDSNEESFDEEELRKQFDDGYDDKLVGDEEDRRRLDEMTEKEREQILYERLEKREALQKRFEIEKKLRLNKMKSKGGSSRQKKKKKKVMQDSPVTEGKAAVRGERRRAMEDKKEKNSQLEDLMAERERKKNKEKKVNERSKLDIRQLFPSDDSSDNDDSNVHISSSRKAGRVSDSETSTDSSASSNSDSEQEEPMKYKRIETKEDLNRLRWTRNSLGKYVHHPFFKELVVGGYCRVGIGNNADKKPMYRACEIVDVCETAKVYTVQLANGHSSKTNIGLRLKHGPQERVFRVLFISNAEFSENEFHKYKHIVESNGSQLPTIDEMKKKLKKIQELKTKKLDDQAVDHIIKQKKKFRKTPFNYAIAKTTLMKEKEMLMQQDNDKEVEKVTKQLEDLEEKAEKLDKIRSENIAGISYINANIKAYNLKKEEASKMEFASRQKNHSDPFTRRRCAPVIVSNTADGEQTQRLIAEMERRYGSGGTKEEDKKESNDEDITVQVKKKHDESIDLYEAHNFDIKLDIDISPEISSNISNEPSFAAPKVSSNSTSTNGPQQPPKRSLNLSDYKKRRGLI